jgi:RDD family
VLRPQRVGGQRPASVSRVAGSGGGSTGGVAGYRGARLGLPERGPGSLAPFGRRLAAVAVDWFSCVLVTLLVVRGRLAYGTPEFSFVVLAIFGLEVFLLTWLASASFGQRLLAVGVFPLDRRRLGPYRAAVRTVLLCMAVPALVWDRDGRGLHDRAVNTAVFRAGTLTPSTR